MVLIKRKPRWLIVGNKQQSSMLKGKHHPHSQVHSCILYFYFNMFTCCNVSSSCLPGYSYIYTVWNTDVVLTSSLCGPRGSITTLPDFLLCSCCNYDVFQRLCYFDVNKMLFLGTFWNDLFCCFLSWEDSLSLLPPRKGSFVTCVYEYNLNLKCVFSLFSDLKPVFPIHYGHSFIMNWNISTHLNG